MGAFETGQFVYKTANGYGTRSEFKRDTWGSGFAARQSRLKNCENIVCFQVILLQ